MLDLNFFLKIGPIVRDRYRKHIFKDAKDVYDRPFKKYSKTYEEAKKTGKLRRQSSQYKGSRAPVLTSDLLRDFSLIKTSTNGFQLGFITFGARVQHLKKMGRVLSDDNQPLPSHLINYLSTKARRYMASKRPQGKKTYRIGK